MALQLQVLVDVQGVPKASERLPWHSHVVELPSAWLTQILGWDARTQAAKTCGFCLRLLHVLLATFCPHKPIKPQITFVDCLAECMAD